VIYREISTLTTAIVFTMTDGLAAIGQTVTALCNAADVPENGILRVVVAGYPPLAVYNLDGAFFVTEDVCSHGEASLSAGFIEGGCIVCPLHFGSFDIRTGAPVDPPCSREIETYAIAEQDGRLLLVREG
jgi:nitrite reductase/ring-hydroxylating ferredoxin subunit